jgi:hypothetical protein
VELYASLPTFSRRLRLYIAHLKEGSRSVYVQYDHHRHAEDQVAGVLLELHWEGGGGLLGLGCAEPLEDKFSALQSDIPHSTGEVKLEGPG